MRVSARTRSRSRPVWGALLALLVIGGWTPARADVSLDDAGLVKSFGDLRLRYENDWNSTRANGTERDDRQRMRLRARIGLKLDPDPHLHLETRLRTGATGSQQSPHITFADFSSDSTGRDKRLLVDKWYARARYRPLTVSAGRMGFPFWKQNELFWDDDVTPLGGALTLGHDFDFGTVSGTAGYFILPDGGVRFNGQLMAGQVTYSTAIEDLALTAATGFFRFNGRTGAVNLRNGNGARDYNIWVGNLRARYALAGVPLAFGVDVMHNAKAYSPFDPDPFTAANFDQDDGYVLSLIAGRLKNGQDWLVGYYYARIEALAVNASFAQDDWVRFGSATQTDSSDFQGHEFRLGYALAPYANLLARLYIVEAITTVQDGNRFRLDFNLKF